MQCYSVGNIILLSEYFYSGIQAVNKCLIKKSSAQYVLLGNY